MQTIQWIVAAGTAIFVAIVGFFQWRTAQQKTALDLFERRHAIYTIIRGAVGQICSSSTGFDPAREIEFMQTMELAYFFFGHDIEEYLKQLWADILDVRTADAELPAANDPEIRRKVLEKRRAALDRVGRFGHTGQPLFARYMRFSQTVKGIL